MDGGADPVNASAVAANDFVESVTGDAELLGPVSDVGGHFWVDLFGVVRALGGGVFMDGVRSVALWSVLMLGHGVFPHFGSAGSMKEGGWRMYPRPGSRVLR
jgi:hypothetical protein